MILSNETNKVYFSAHLQSDYPVFFKRMKAVLEQYGIEMGVLQETEDYWCRDYMPLQVAEDRFVKYRYFPNYLDKPKVCRYRTEVEKSWSHLGIDDKCLVDLSDITLDGGNMVKTPYHVIMTDKIFTENKNIKRDVLLKRLEDAFQSEVLIMPWYGKKEDPCGHTDGMVRFIKGKELLTDNYSKFNDRFGKRINKILEQHGYTVHELDVPYVYDYTWAYINFLQTFKVIVIPKFGLKADEYAYKQISSLFDTPVVQIPAPSIIKEYGGAFNCMSWNIKNKKLSI
jgi:agmatine/peptidylarginine deiminase